MDGRIINGWFSKIPIQHLTSAGRNVCARSIAPTRIRIIWIDAFKRKRSLGAPAVKCVCLQLCLPHGFHGGDFPARQRATTRSKLSGKGRGLRPVYLPCSLAIAIPSRWRCKMYSRSSSATAANTVSINLPVGVVVSIASLRLTNSTCFSVSRSTRSSKSRVFLAKRLIDSTITVSPRRT